MTFFFIIKSILNFPKIIYLLCFDKDTVFKKLESLNNKNKSIYESDYFKKIINVFLELPIPNVCRLASLVFEELETYFKKFDENLEYWEIIFFYFLQKYFNTIYDCKRLLNIIKITYPTVKDEVNIIDFIIIRLIEIFFPNIYKLIYQNSNMFVDLNSIESDESADIYYSDQKVEEFHNNWLKNVSKNDRDNIIPLLSLLFPRFENAINKKIISNSSYNVKKFAISNLNNFFVYFNYSQPERGLSAKEFKVILSNVKNKKYFKEKLLELLNKSNKRLEAFLKMMIDYTDEIQIDDIPNILEVFFDMGDKILNLSYSQYYDDYINEIILKLIQKYNNINERFKILKEMFLKSNSISIIVNVLFMLGSQHNKYGLLGTTKNNFPNEYLLSVEQVGDLGKIVLSKIEKGIKENNLINTPRLWYVLYIWLFLAKDYSMKKIGKWIEEIIKTDDNLIKFIRNILNVGLKLKITNSDERIFWNPCNLERFGYFLDPSKIIKRCETIYYTLPNWLSDDDKYVLEKFLKYNFLTKLRKNKK